MEQNVGPADRYIRIALGSTMLAMGAARMAREDGLSGLAAGLAGGIMLAEGVLGTCPLYSAYGISTNREREAPYPGEESTNDTIRPYEGI